MEAHRKNWVFIYSMYAVTTICLLTLPGCVTHFHNPPQYTCVNGQEYVTQWRGSALVTSPHWVDSKMSSVHLCNY